MIQANPISTRLEGLRPNRHHRRAAASRRGGALLFSVIAISVIAALAAASFQLTVATTKEQATAVQQRTALYVAEAGLAESYAGLMQGRTGDVGSEQSPAAFGDGLFWVKATPRTDGTVQLESTGMVRGGSTKLSLVVQPGGISVAALGVFSSKPLDVPPGSTLDGYDSRQGAYVAGEGLTLGIEGRVGSNGAVTISGTPTDPTLIQADIIAGPSSGVAIGANVTVEGDSGSAYQTVSLPDAELPTMPDGTDKDHGGNVPLVLLPEEEVHSALKVQAGSEVVIKGPGVFAYESLFVDELGSLVIDATEGRVTIFVENEMTFAPRSLLTTTTNSPLDVSLVVTGTPSVPCQMAATGEFHGAVFAPDADLQIGPDMEFFGALVADGLDFQGPAKVHVDQALASAAAEEWLPKVVSWRILEMTPGRKVAGRMVEDPFDALGVAQGTLRSPSLAHVDQVLEVEYLDTVSTQQNYSGAESAFDWSDVDTLISASRDGQPFVRPTDEPVLNPSPAVAEGSVALDPTSERLIVSIEDDQISSGHLRNLLYDESPLSDAVLLAAINRKSAMRGNHLNEILSMNPQAGDAVWIRAVGAHFRTAFWDLKSHFISISPISQEILDAIKDRYDIDPFNDDADYQEIVDAQ